MDISGIVQVVGSLGFPIACCIYMFWYNSKRDSDEKEEREMHKQEVSELKDAISNNTLVMQKLIDKLGGD